MRLVWGSMRFVEGYLTSEPFEVDLPAARNAQSSGRCSAVLRI